MNKPIPYFLSSHKVTLFLDGKPHTIHSDNLDFDLIRESILESDWDRVKHILENPTPTGEYDHGEDHIKIDDDKITYNGVTLEHALVHRLKEMRKSGLKDATPWLNFIQKVMRNPSQRIRETLHTFIEDQHMALTPEGNVLAYKGVREDFKDIFSGTIDNTPGQIVIMDRGGVDDNAEHTCSNGLHVGDYDYARNWGSNGKLLLVEFDPADAVSVPIDGQKLRVCKYKVLQEIEHDQPLSEPLYQVDPDNAIHPMSNRHPSYTKARECVKNSMEYHALTVNDLMDNYHGLSRQDVGRICGELGVHLVWNSDINDFVITDAV